MAANARTTLRNAWLAALANDAGPNPKIRARTGAKPADADAPRSGTVLVTIILADGFDTPADGEMGLVTPGPTGLSVDVGEIEHWELVTNDGSTVVLQGDEGEILSFNNTTIDDVGQEVAIASFDLVAPNP